MNIRYLFNQMPLYTIKYKNVYQLIYMKLPNTDIILRQKYKQCKCNYFTIKLNTEFLISYRKRFRFAKNKIIILQR